MKLRDLANRSLGASTPGRPNRASAVSARNPLATLNRLPARRASSSTTRKPTLCRCPAYAGPGLPRPTTSQGDIRSGVGGLGLGLLGSLGWLGPSGLDTGLGLRLGQLRLDRLRAWSVRHVDDQGLGIDAQRGAVRQLQVPSQNLRA